MFDDVPNSVYLTFDDNLPVTKDILKVLKEKMLATFLLYNDSSEAAELLRLPNRTYDGYIVLPISIVKYTRR